MTRDDAMRRLQARGLSEQDASTVLEHLDHAERSGKTGHGYARIPWLETLSFDPGSRPAKVASDGCVDRWEGRGTLGYLVLDAVCEDLLAGPPAPRIAVAAACFPTGVLGYWARRLAAGGLVALVTATSPRRLPHPDGGPPLTGTNPLAIAVPSSDGSPLVADVSMGAVTHGDVLSGRARPEELVPFGGEHAHKAFALAAGLQLVVEALAGPEEGAVVVVAPAAFDPVPGFRALAGGLRLPGDA